MARPRAHGQAMISTDTAAVKAAVGLSEASSQPTRVPSAIRITTGTKTAEIRSARRCAAALPFCACSTSFAIRASCVSAPIRVASTTRRPPAFTVAPVTWSPTVTSTGTDSPVSIEASTAELPSTTVPSVAIFSPGRTTNSIPTASRATGSLVSRPSSRTATSLTPSPSRACRAAPARRFERASSQRPSRISVVTAAAVSR